MINEKITTENLINFLATFIDKNNLSLNEVAKVIGCSKATLQRILGGVSLPSNKMLKQCGILISIGFEKYKKLSNAEKENISEKIGAVGGGVLGFGAITSAISASGIAGLSAAGLTSGLAAIGGIVGGSMVAGILLSAAIPITVGAIGYGIIKGIKSLIKNKKINTIEFDSLWEIEKQKILTD